MAKKVENDTAAFVRSIAAERGRNADWAEKAVRESVSATGEEAVKLGVVDFVAPDLRAALDVADGRRGRRRRGRVEGPPHPGRGARDAYEPTVRQRPLSFLADPNVVALLMLLGTLGIAIEFYHPGVIFPGAVGAFCLLLAFLAMRVIPVNVGRGAAHPGRGRAPRRGGLRHDPRDRGGGGAICIVLGTALLHRPHRRPTTTSTRPPSRVSPWMVWPTPVALAAVLGFMAWKVAARAPGAAPARRRRRSSAPRGDALADVGPEAGEVFVHGEYWQARSAEPDPEGARVRVAAVDGLAVDGGRRAAVEPA